MGTFVKACSTKDLSDNTIKHISVAGKNICLAKIGNEYFCVDDTCTHEQCSLGDEGFLDGNLVTCGCHGSQFDITSGKVLSLPAVRDLKSYAVKVHGENILIDL